MARELAVDGVVRRVEYSEKPNPKGGLYRNGKIVLSGEFDKLEIGLGMGASDEVVRKLRALGEGEIVRLQVEVSSGDSWQSEPRFNFLDDLTSKPTKG
jgi:hypothetical protein